MKDRIANITRWILYVLWFIGALVGVLFYTHALGSWGGSAGGSGVGSSNLIYMGTIFFYLGIIVLFIAPVYTMINNPKNIGKMVASVVILIAILAVSYGVASSYLSANPHHISPEVSRLVGAGLYAIYITLGLAVISILYSAVIKIIK